MFKRTASVAILVMLILSFTVSSVSNATAYQTTAMSVSVTDQLWDRFPGPAGISATAVSMAAEGFPESAVMVTHAVGMAAEGYQSPGVRAFPEAGTAPEIFSASSFEAGCSTMVIDMGSLEFEPPFISKGEFLHGQLFTTADAMILTGNYLTSHREGGAVVGNMKLYKPGSSSPKTFPVRWEANGSHGHDKPVYFAHVRINMSDVDPDGMPGFVELTSSIVLDESKLKGSYVIVNDSSIADIYTSEIEAGDDSWHTITVGEAVESVNVDVKWSETSSKIRLMIYTPDGSVLGPYYDDSDEQTDGRINLNITNSDGLAAGEWYLKLTDTDDVGSTDYYVKTY